MSWDKAREEMEMEIDAIQEDCRGKSISELNEMVKVLEIQASWDLVRNQEAYECEFELAEIKSRELREFNAKKQAEWEASEKFCPPPFDVDEIPVKR